jgi:hypothetical protein
VHPSTQRERTSDFEAVQAPELWLQSCGSNSRELHKSGALLQVVANQACSQRFPFKVIVVSGWF